MKRPPGTFEHPFPGYKDTGGRRGKVIGCAQDRPYEVEGARDRPNPNRQKGTRLLSGRFLKGTCSFGNWRYMAHNG